MLHFSVLSLSLPPSGLQCHNMDPAYDIPDGVQKSAEQVVREVVKEVHGPFFNSEVRTMTTAAAAAAAAVAWRGGVAV